MAFKIITSQALLGQKITSSDLYPLQGHFGSQVKVIIWVRTVILQYGKTSFGRHIRLEIRYYAHCTVHIYVTDFVGVQQSKISSTFHDQILPLPRDLDLRSNFDLEVFR